MKIDVTHLTMQYGEVSALDDVSFSIPDNSIAGLVGPNGAGKSTLLRLMMCRELPVAGDIFYDGTSLLDRPQELLPSLGLMPDALPSTSQWCVGPYLDFFARANGLKGEARQSKLDEVITLMKLESFLERKLDALSKGMKQRVSMARILLGNPRVLLLDEPSAGLDPNARIELRNSLHAIWQSGVTIFISSHILSDLEDICDSLVILEQGHLRWSGKLSDWKSGNSGKAVRLLLEFIEMPDDVETLLKSFSGCQSVVLQGRRSVEVVIAGEALECDAFLSALFQAHIPVCGMRMLNRSIEEIFQKNTQGGIQ